MKSDIGEEEELGAGHAVEENSSFGSAEQFVSNISGGLRKRSRHSDHLSGTSGEESLFDTNTITR